MRINLDLIINDWNANSSESSIHQEIHKHQVLILLLMIFYNILKKK